MKLLIPGPVTTRAETRAALGQDVAPWDNDFRVFHARQLARLLRLAGGRGAEHTTLALPGCGHFVTEAAIRTFIPQGGKLLVPMTGAYGERMARLAREAGRVPVVLPVPDGTRVRPHAVAEALSADPGITHVGQIYSETGTGVVHDVVAIGAAVRLAGRRLLVDAVSAFGALPLDLSVQPEIDAVVFTANKCLESVPGVAFAVARTDRLTESAGNAGSWSFDLADIYAMAQRAPGAARFTPPAQVLCALDVALDLLELEGGLAARLARYTANMRTLYDGLLRLGLTPFLPRAVQGPIIANVHAPTDPNWHLQSFVDALKSRGFVISNFYTTDKPGFRVGCIGAIGPEDMTQAVAAMDAALTEIGVTRREAA